MHAACRTLLESHCLHRVLDQTTRAHVVRTWRKIRHAEIAEIVSDSLSGSGNLFSSTWLKVDAESEGLKALHCFPVFVRDLPYDDSCRVKAQDQALQLFSRLESYESTVLIVLWRELGKSIAPNRNSKGTGRKIGKHKRAVWAGANDALRTGSLRCVGFGRVEFDLCLRDRFNGVGAVDVSGNLSPPRPLWIVFRLRCCKPDERQQDTCPQRSGNAKYETHVLAIEL